MIQLLQTELGAGYQAPYSVPVGLASTAAMAVLAPVAQSVQWAGSDLDITWRAPAAASDVIVADATLEQLSDDTCRFAVTGMAQDGSVLYRGLLRMTAMRDGHPTVYRSQAEYEAVRASLMAATLPDSVTSGPVRAIHPPAMIPLGGTAVLEIEVRNDSRQILRAHLELRLPFGAGLSLNGPPAAELDIEPCAAARTSFTLCADRPDEVNLGKPWQVEIAALGQTVRIPIPVPDPNPGRTFYLLTEDCETFDGGPRTGNYAGSENLGNHNNFMDPEDYRIQMIQKPNRLNEIAERHGARWTHFYAVTQCFAAEWAEKQSGTGEWRKVIDEISESVAAGSRLHDYCPHIHFDYEPDSAMPPQPRLIYDQATDGILPNEYYDPVTNPKHRYHDWDGSARGHSYLKRPGDFTDLDSKTGSLRKCVGRLARWSANRRAPVIARTGSYDFGKSAEDQAASTNAYLANGLRGNSDVYQPGSLPGPGGRMRWSSGFDRAALISRLEDARLVQLVIGMDTGFHSAEEMNEWFAGEAEMCRGPGVHAILFTCHAMFLKGEPDPFRSLEGGDFERLDQHLAWVRRNYPEIEFATGSEAVLEFLDYYAPALEAHTEPHLCGGDPRSGTCEFHVRLLGRGIRVDRAHPATVRVTAPPCFSPSEILEMQVIQQGAMVASVTDPDERYAPSLTVTLVSREPLRVRVRLKPHAMEDAWRMFEEDGQVIFHDIPEPPGPDLLRIASPSIQGRQVRYSTDGVRLLMNPVAGGAEPLGRRIHPLAGYAVGAALTAALHEPVAQQPERLTLRWRSPLDLECGFVVALQSGSEARLFQIHDDRGRLLADGTITVKEVAATGAPVAAAPRERPDPAAIAAARLERGIQAWQRDFDAALATLRRQRAWRVMLLVRALYDQLLNRGFVAFIRFTAALLAGRRAGLDEYEPNLPEPENYIATGTRDEHTKS